MTEDQYIMLSYYLFNVLFITASSYLVYQWLVYPTQRRRFRVCRPYLTIGWILYIPQLIHWLIWLGIPLPSRSHYYILLVGGTFMLCVPLTLIAALRLLRANSAERRATSATPADPPPDGSVWPPPPTTPQ